MNDPAKYNPLVSIVVPCYNHEQFVQECIRSTIDQDYRNIELIIIDDGSKDNSVEKIKDLIPACQKRFVRFEFRSRPNKGLCATLNEALDWCEGDYFSPFASDDIAVASKTSFLIGKMHNSNFLAVFGIVKQIGHKTHKKKYKKIIHTFNDLICGINIPAAPAALINTSAAKNAGGYDESLPIEDWYMWLKLTQTGGNLASYPEVVALYRRHDGNTTNNKIKMQASRLQLLENFKEEQTYERAIKNTYLQSARDFAEENKLHSLRLLVKSLPPRKNTAFVLLKILAPKLVLDFIRK